MSSPPVVAEATAAPRRSAPRRPEPRRPWTFGVTLGALSALTLLVAGRNLGSSPLWYDEAASSYGSSITGTRLIEWLEVDANMWAYQLLLRGWRLGWGDGEAALRTPSVLAAAGAVVVVGVLGRRWFGPRVGLIAGALLAVDPWTIRYARSARSYALVLLVVALSLLVLDDAERRPGRIGPRLAWTGLAVVAVYLHLWTVFVLAAELLALALARGRPIREVMRSRSPDLTAILVLSLPLLWVAKGSGQLSWLPVPAPEDALTVAALLGGWALVGAVVALLALVGGRTLRGLPRALILWTVVLPIGPAVVLSFVQPLLHPRYLIVCLPAVVLAAAVGIDAIGRRLRMAPRSIALMAAVLVAVLLAASVGVAREGPLEDWRGVTEHLARETGAGRGALVVVTPDFATLAMQEQLTRTPLPDVPLYDPAVGCPGSPADLDDCLLDRETVWVVERLDSDRRTWFDPPVPFIAHLAARGWTAGPTIELAHLRVTPYAPPS